MSQQLVKKGTNGKHENVMPRSWIEAIKDKNTGQTLVEILQGFNMYFLPYNGNTSSTRCLVPTILRKKGLWITYVKYDGNVYTEWYAADKIDDKSWGDSSNWRIGNNTLVGDITISANGNWVINGTETEFKAVGKKGNTPLLRVANNRLQVSYDLGDTYIDVTNNPVYTKFRWLATTGDTQANNVGRIQASTDEGKTWTNISNDFTNNLHIKKYIGVNESLPTSGIAEGTIYAKGPYYAEDDALNDNPIYRLWVYAWKGNTLAWQDNGEFTGITAGVVQETGNSETEVMSQKAVTTKLSELESELSYIYFSDRGKPSIVTNAPGSQYASFTITMPDATLRAFVDGDNRIVNKAVTSDETFTIKDTQGLYYNTESLIFSIKTIGTETIGEKELFLFGNSAGVAFGPLSKYYYDNYAYEAFSVNNNQNGMFKGLHSYWYFSDRGKPNIVTNSYGNAYASFTITMPDAYIRGFYNNNERIANVRVSSNDVYKIGNTQALYYNISSQSIVVKTIGTDSIEYNDFCLFGNSSGVAFGLLAQYYYDDYAFDLLSKQDEMMAYSKKIPSYFNEQLESARTTIINRSDVGTEGEQFIFISDLHWAAANSQNSPSLVNYLLRKTPMSKVFLGGDYISSYSTKEAARDRLIMCTNQFKNLPADVFFLYGNHDNNSNQSNTSVILSPKEVFCLLQSQMKGIVYGDYYYFYTDNPTTKTRFLCLSSGPMPDADSETGISTAEYNWVREILQNTPKDYHCIVFIHAVKSNADGDYTASAKELFSILDDNNASGGCRVEAVFSGHTHKDFNGYTDGGIPVIIIDTDGTGTVGDIAAEVGTITEQCFDAVTIDYDNKVIYCDRIGRGQSRVINY